jgi:copper homeostasis protein (lipoprotein)
MPFLKQLLTSFFLIAVCSSNQPVFAEIADVQDHDAHHANNSLEWPGIYRGFTPCGDCNGVKTSLALNTNQTYILITQYIGKSLREFVEKGKFTWDNNANTIVLKSRDGAKTHYYLLEENQLIQLDEQGNHIGGSDAQRYILRRNDVMLAPPPEHSSH